MEPNEEIRKVKGIILVIQEACKLNKWEEASFREALILMTCAYFIEKGLKLIDLKKFMSDTWNYLEQLKKDGGKQ
jgi:hypothetical protein